MTQKFENLYKDFETFIRSNPQKRKNVWANLFFFFFFQVKVSVGVQGQVCQKYINNHIVTSPNMTKTNNSLTPISQKMLWFLESVTRRCSVKGVVKNFANLAGKHLCWILF